MYIKEVTSGVKVAGEEQWSEDGNWKEEELGRGKDSPRAVKKERPVSRENGVRGYPMLLVDRWTRASIDHWVEQWRGPVQLWWEQLEVQRRGWKPDNQIHQRRGRETWRSERRSTSLRHFPVCDRGSLSLFSFFLPFSDETDYSMC